MPSAAIPKRENIPEEHKWNLSALYPSTEEWEKDLKRLEEHIPGLARFKGSLSDSAARLKECLDLIIQEVDLLEERLGYYAMLRREENVGDSDAQGRFSRYVTVATKLAAAASWISPELQSIPDEVMDRFRADPLLKDYEIYLIKLLRFKKYTLTEKEEALLAQQGEFSQAPQKAFSALTNVDLKFGEVETSNGTVPLTNTTYGMIMIDPDRSVREKAYKQFYSVFEGHAHTLSELYNGSVQKDVFNARVRGYAGAREKALYPDKVPGEVYDNLVGAVHEALPALHDYYKLKKETLGLDTLRHYDVYASLIRDVKSAYPYEEAVDLITQALAPLGEEYTETLKEGLLGDWVDRYENEGKRSGAFSAGSYRGKPYILMNYKDDDIRHLFTLAHEGGHSMHSWYSIGNNPFQHYNYTIFEAEVASTFNEQLLADWMLKNRANSREMKAYLIGKQIDDTVATIFRQTMFAEYEDITHKMVEAGTPLTVESLRQEYRKLLEAYFGPAMTLEPESDLEGLRIPHFYSAFYVYKYATGLSAAIALSRRVLDGGDREREDYLSFLKSGGSRFPIESLKVAGVDMSSPEPVKAAMAHFSRLVTQFRELMNS
ncbi:MAG: oligoendopeptidase F [Spirochaetales bacterium]|nr:oligoendopeptidase F [Spirochaetales bacterium]